MILDLPRFLAAGRPSWEKLEKMLARMEADAGVALSFAELREFHRLYQRVSADLARVQTFATRPEIYGYLESLTARAYAEINEARPRGTRPRLGTWLGQHFPRVFRRHGRAFGLAVLITLAGALFGAGALRFDPESKRIIFPQTFSHLYQDPAERVRKEETVGRQRHRSEQEASFAAMLMQNNIHVSIVALALGMTWGLGTAVLLFYNGVILGAVVLDYVRAGQTPFLLGWLLPHGVTEIPAILIAGQAGFILGRALLGGAGRASLPERLRVLGPDVLTLAGGFVVLLIWAGLVESFFSQAHQPVIPYSAKIAFGCAQAGLLAWFLWFRPVPPAPEP